MQYLPYEKMMQLVSEVLSEPRPAAEVVDLLETALGIARAEAEKVQTLPK